MKKMNVHTIRLDEVDSTNTYLRRMENLPDADIVVVTAGHQTAGRGMGSNRWESEDGRNLLFSMLVRPEGVPAARQFALSMSEALAVKDALDPIAGEVTLKWPNDVYWHDRKISGTLIETAISGRLVKDCIRHGNQCQPAGVPKRCAQSGVAAPDNGARHRHKRCTRQCAGGV